MKVTKEQSAANREAMVSAASKLYQERGIAGVGLAEIARAAGFTNGGFYARFSSKEELAAEACSAAFESSLSRLRRHLKKHGGNPAPFLKRYFGTAQRDDPGSSCPMTTLAVDAAREGGLIKQTMAEGIGRYLDELAAHRPDGSIIDVPDAADQARAIAMLATMVGGMVLARACSDSDSRLSEQILKTAFADATAKSS